MPGYRKKRRNVGPSKNEEKVARAKTAERQERSAAVLGAIFPELLRLDLKISLLYPGTNVLGEQSMSLGPTDPCRFTVACPGRCGSGSFDLVPHIRKAVLALQTDAMISERCKETLYAGSVNRCDCELRCALTASYRPPAEKPAEAAPAAA